MVGVGVQFLFEFVMDNFVGKGEHAAVCVMDDDNMIRDTIQISYCLSGQLDFHFILLHVVDKVA